MRPGPLSGNAYLFRLGLLVACVFWFHPTVAQTEIHKCTDAEGGIVYSQLPCVPQKTVEKEATEPEEESGYPPPVSIMEEPAVKEAPQEEPALDADRSACKKHYRDAIDAIDAEIGREYTPEKAEQYKQRLLLLTRELRQC
jgi:hypothetical protein